MTEINHWSQACEIWYGGSWWTHHGILYKILFKVNSYKLRKGDKFLGYVGES